MTNELSPIPYVCEKNMYACFMTSSETHGGLRSEERSVISRGFPTMALGKTDEGDKLDNFEIDLQFKYYECCSYTHIPIHICLSYEIAILYLVFI